MLLASELHTPVDAIEAWPVAKTRSYLEATTRLISAKHGKAKR